MPFYQRCWGCPCDKGKPWGWPCELKEVWKKKVACLGLTSINFSCAKLRDHYSPGMLVALSLPDRDLPDSIEVYRGVIMRWQQRTGKLVIWILDGPYGAHYVLKRWAKDVRILGGVMEICRECGMPVAAENAPDDWDCPVCILDEEEAVW